MAAPNRWELYRHAVQHPEAEVRFMLRAWAHHRAKLQRSKAGATRDTMRGKVTRPMLLCEDFCGTAHLAATWVMLDPEHQAMAVDVDQHVLKRAHRLWGEALGERADDLHLVCDKAEQVRSPRVDLIAAMNFSTFIYHQRHDLLKYFRNARRRLKPGGVLVLDAFGGPGAMIPRTQWRTVTPDDPQVPSFKYGWEQRSFDAVTSRIDCRIHFHHRNWKINSAFRYDWRLWSPVELAEVLREAGFPDVAHWAHPQRAVTGVGRDGRVAVTRHIRNRYSFVSYLSAGVS